MVIPGLAKAQKEALDSATKLFVKEGSEEGLEVVGKKACKEVVEGGETIWSWKDFWKYLQSNARRLNNGA